ncbi:MAG: HAMP domain-containing histidine kinase [Gracilibacteraceae bacterium]|jgi:signal transduction histidine kinase|nr:HAMP domain-containing histidine kinase [Gracilibacteraceae bacterium]
MPAKVSEPQEKSLTRRLNGKLVSRQLSVFLFFDALLLLLCFVIVFIYAEWSAAEYQAAGLTPGETPTPAGPGCVAVLVAEMPADARQVMTLDRLFNATLWREWDLNGGIGFWDNLGKVAYRFYFPCQGGFALFTVAAGRFLRAGFALMSFLLVWQIFMFISVSISNRRDIAAVLRPLRELSDYARVISAGAGGAEGLKTIAGALAAISGDDLHERVPLSGFSEDLRPLAQSVNEMLERLDASYRSQMRFVSDASHELRTPIAVIHGYANLLTRWGAEDPATLRESVQAIKTEAEAMKELIDKLLFLARGDSDSIKPEMKTLMLEDIGIETLREIEMIDAAHRYSAVWQPAPPVRGDAGLIKQLLRIIIDNSMKYTPVGGHITISVGERRSENGAEAFLAVTDEGPGIPAEALPHLFDRFYRADSSRTGATGGSGLGLSIARWIAEQHGGVIEVTSRPGIGARFALLLPAAAGPQ